MSKDVTAKVPPFNIPTGAPVFDTEGNKIGFVKGFKLGEDGKAEVLAEITDATAEAVVRGKNRSFSIGTKSSS